MHLGPTEFIDWERPMQGEVNLVKATYPKTFTRKKQQINVVPSLC